MQLIDGRVLPSRVTIWAAGFGVPDLAFRSGLRTDAAGRLLTDETLPSLDDLRIVAAGDSAAPSDLPFRASCQAATRIGAHAADTVLRRIAEERPDPINLGFSGQCISLGRRAGIFQFANKNDIAKGIHIGGGLGAMVKKLVCKQTVENLASEAREPGSLSWIKDDTRRQLLGAKGAEAAADSASQDR